MQILALVIYSADDKPLFPVGKRITVSSATNGSLQSQWQTTDDCLGFDLACTMHRLPGLTTGEDPVERTGKAADFVRELQNAIKDTGKQLYLVLHAPTAIVPDKSLIGMSLSSTEEFTETATRWFRALDDNSNVVGMLSENTDRLLKNAPLHCEPFIWRVVQDGNQPQSVFSHNQSAGDNKLSLSLSFTDKSGATVTCSNVQFNAVPNSEDFQRCRTVRDFERLASELEQGLIKTVREVETAFMNQTLGAGSISENQKKKIIKDPGQDS